MNAATHEAEGNAPAPVLYMALELSNRRRLAFGDGAKHRQVSVANSGEAGPARESCADSECRSSSWTYSTLTPSSFTILPQYA